MSGLAPRPSSPMPGIGMGFPVTPARIKPVNVTIHPVSSASEESEESEGSYLSRFDPSAYKRGDIIGTEELERIVGVSRASPEWRIRGLAIRDRLRRHHNWKVSVSFERNRLEILRDGNDQYSYAQKQVSSLQRRLRQAIKEVDSVDQRKLSDDLRNGWLADREKNARLRLSINEARRGRSVIDKLLGRVRKASD